MKPLLRLIFIGILIFLIYNIIAELSFHVEDTITGEVPGEKVFIEKPNSIRVDRPKNAPLEAIRAEPIKFENKKQVLIYSATKFFNMDVTTERFLGNCHSTKGYCRISENPADLEKADAVLFHNADFQNSRVPTFRKAERPHILWSLESQVNDRYRPGPDVINWTMTPLMHSDIWYPYGHCEKRPQPVVVDLDSLWNMKTQKTAVWLASNCFTQNRRKDLIESLVRYGVDADLFGRCGRPAPDCDGVEKQGYDCVKTLIRKYKFYFSIENSNCKDYITEKFWAALGERYAVPIVLERKKYEAVGAPPNSFVAIDDFKTLKEAADHIIKVSQNKDEYLKYHQWRNTHQVFEEHDDATGFCELCRRLQSPPYKQNSYASLGEFQSQNQCNQDYARAFLS